jgi:replication-associated recombination protein RarA
MSTLQSQSLLFAELALDPPLNFPEPLSERYRPERIADFAGLGEVKKVLAGFAARPMNAGLLFVGSAGTGKTSMGLALAHEIQGFVHHVSAGNCSVAAVRELAFSCWYVAPNGFKRHVVLIDEADQMSKEAQLAVLSYLDGTETIPDTVWIFTCNETEKLAERFISRNRVLNFSTYGIQADAATLLESVWTKEAAPDAAKPNFARIIKEATGNVRAALMTLEMKLYAV